MMNKILLILFDPDVYVWGLIGLLTIVTVVAFLACRRRCRRLWPRLLVSLVLAFCWYVLLVGSFYRVRSLEVRQVEYASKDLPEAFDGYRIVQFSDAHVGSFNGWRKQLLYEFVDSIKAQKGDVIIFTGDLINKRPEEMEPFVKLLSGLKAPNGVFSVLGNHDYPMYIDASPLEQQAILEKTCAIEEDMGWTLLKNSHRFIHRGQDSIVIAGMQNDGEGRFPAYGNITNALYGLSRDQFVVMLEHDPTSWRRKILRHSHSQLTLSGHTHGGQFAFFGYAPAQLNYKELGGMYYIGDRAMNVSTGIGGVIPIRFGVTPEICVITLRKK